MIFPLVSSSSLVPLGSSDVGINVTGGKTGPTLPSGNTAGKVRIKIVTEEIRKCDVQRFIQKPCARIKIAFLAMYAVPIDILPNLNQSIKFQSNTFISKRIFYFV